MPITRTPIYDDSGAGTDGTVIDNAWKQEFYNQIDAVLGSYGTFTPVDVSGASLAFTTAAGHYWVAGRQVTIALQVVFPATANGLAAKLGGLPFVFSVGHGAFYQGYGAVPVRTWGAAGTNAVDLFAAATGATLTNAALSGVNLTLHGVHLRA